MRKYIVRVNGIVKNVYIISSIIFLLYLGTANQNFPKQLPNSLQSSEPADIETPLRRSYFSDNDRTHVMSFFRSQYEPGIFSMPFFTYGLNYPPEEAQTIIRDQTRSSYLEEIVHPFRESLYINGYEPKENKDVILINNKFWKYKITVKLQESNVLMRLIIGVMIIFVTPFIYLNFLSAVSDLFRAAKKIWSN